jgi:GT2 family glycosyltransferase
MKASIIIPIYNRLDLTSVCLETIYKIGSKNSFEVIVVDNASSDGSKEYLKGYRKRIKYIRNEENLGFAKACNQGAENAIGEYLLFLNNDTKPTKGWLDILVKELDDNRKTVIVGSKLLYPNDTIQHAGVVFGKTKEAYHLYKFHRKEKIYVNKKRKFQAVTGACMLIRKNIFEKINGFDEIYVNGLEDVDLCLKVGKIGADITYCPKSVVYHFESMSEGRSKKILRILKFLLKNGKII